MIKAFDRERFNVGTLPIWVHYEHKARWEFACKQASEKVIVDCACGVGLGTAMFAKAGASRVYAFDLSEEAIASVRQNCASWPNIVFAQQANGCELPLKNNSIDLFISFETIEHIDDDRSFLTEVVRVLRPGGSFLCSTPNRVVTMPGKALRDRPWNPFHIREYSSEEFRDLLREYFGSIQMFGQNPKTAWRTAIMGWIGQILPGNMGGRINSAFKLPRLIYDNEINHSVKAWPQAGTCEYLVMLCTAPK